VRKLIGEDPDSLIGEGRGEKTKQSKGNCLLHPTGRPMLKLVSKQPPPWKSETPFFCLYLRFYHWVWCCMTWNSPLASSGWLPWPGPIPVSCLPMAYSLQGQSGNCSATAKRWVCYWHCFSHKSKTQNHTGYYEESYLRLSQTQYKGKRSWEKDI